MTAHDMPQSSPWRTVWLGPSATIERILPSNSWHQLIGLMALIGIANCAALLVVAYGSPTPFIDTRAIIGIAVVGAVAGVVDLCLMGCFLAWTGKLFGGRAPMRSVFAALAWSGVPAAACALICTFALVLLERAGIIRPPGSTIGPNIIVLVLGIWTLVYLVVMYRRVQGFGRGRAIANLAVAMVLLGSLLALTIRTLLFQPFDIPSGSNMPTLLAGDYFFVSKYSYGYTHYSLPFSPRLFSGRLFASLPQRGDMAVFRLPKDDSINYIKRIVGLPGDRIQMVGGVLQINGQPIVRERIADFVADQNGRPQRVKQWRQTLPNGVSYNVLDLTDNGFYDNTPLFTVPADHYFVVGDNLDNSSDSRALSQVGYIPFENLIGRASFIFFSIDRDTPSPTIRYDRIGTIVR